MLDMSYLPSRPGTPPEVRPSHSLALSTPGFLPQVVPRLRAALLGLAKVEREEKTSSGKVYRDKKEAVARLLEPPPYMRGKEVTGRAIFCTTLVGAGAGDPLLRSSQTPGGQGNQADRRGATLY